jgi:hypothetical protein
LRDCAFYGVVCVGGRRAEGVRGVPVTGIVLAKTFLGLFYEGCDLRFKERRNGRYRNLRPVDIGTLCGRDIGLAGLSVLDPPIAEEIVRPIDPAAQRRRFIGGKL